MRHESKKLSRIDSFVVWILVTSCENQRYTTFEYIYSKRKK